MLKMADLPDINAVREALRQVDDPEAGMNIVDLGLVYGIAVHDNFVHVELTMTTAACPMAEMIVEQAREVVRSLLPDTVVVDIELVWDPPWTPDKMTEFARAHFGWGS